MSEKAFSIGVTVILIGVLFAVFAKCEADCEARRCRDGAKAQLVRGLGGPVFGWTCACIEEP